MKKEFQHKCIECGSENVIYDPDLNEVTCNDCSAIYEELTPKDEKLEEEVKGVFPKARIIRWDSDIASGKNAHAY